MSALALAAVLAAIGAAIAAIVIAYAWTQVMRNKIRLLTRTAEILHAELEQMSADIAKLKALSQFEAGG